jgi:signal transduction histidine kinase
MGWIENHTIGVRLRYGFGIIVAMVLALGAVAMVEMNSVANSIRQMHEHPLKVGNAVRDIRTEIVKMHQVMKDLLPGGNAKHIQAVLDDMNQDEKVVESLFQDLRERYLGDPEEVKAAYQSFVDWKPIRLEEIELVRKGQNEAAMKLSKDKGDDQVDAIQELILPISNFATAKAESFYRDAMRSKDIHLWVLSGLVILIGGASIVTGVTITRSITDPVDRIIREMGIIAEGNLDHKIRMDRSDEIGHLARAFDEMTKSLQKTTASRNELNATNQHLVASEQQLRAANEQLQATNQQLAATEQQLRATNQQLLANEQQLQAANKQLKAGAEEMSFRNAELQSVVYTVSHDLKSPLVNIKGFGEELACLSGKLTEHLSGAELPPAIRREIQPLLEEEIPKSLHYIQASAAKMKRLLDGFLRVSKIRSAPIQKEPLDMNALVESVLATMRFQIESWGVTVTADPLPPCTGDWGQINQAISNLVDNALKYRDPGRACTIHITGRREGDWVTYGVSDNGIGIDPRYQDKVFEMFGRLDPNSQVSGDGLGLTIVSQILDRHGGRIRLESEPGKGSTFFISLPCGESSSPSATTPMGL